MSDTSRPLGAYSTCSWKGRLLSHLLLGHVQEPHGVSVAVEEGSDCVQGFVELPLDVRKFLKDFAPGPQQYLKKHQNGAQVLEAQRSSWLSKGMMAGL